MRTYTIRNSTDTHLGEWFCSLCDKSMNVKSKTGHINSNFHERRERLAFTVKK